MKEASWQQSSKAYKQASKRALMHQSKQRTDIQWIQRCGQAKQANKQCSDEASESIKVQPVSQASYKARTTNNQATKIIRKVISHACKQIYKQEPNHGTRDQQQSRSTQEQQRSNAKAKQSKEYQSKTKSDSKAN